MPFIGLSRTTISYDGALSALQLGGQWEAALDMLTWMDREIPATPKSIITYQTVRNSFNANSKFYNDTKILCTFHPFDCINNLIHYPYRYSKLWTMPTGKTTCASSTCRPYEIITSYLGSAAPD